MIETKISLDYEGVLELGRFGEEEARCFIFDLTPWADTFPSGGTVSLLLRRPWEKASYPAVLAVEDGKAAWTVRSGDVALPGSGRAELRYEVDGAVVLSRIWETQIGTSLAEPEGAAPDPAQPWVDEVLQAAERAESAADEAVEACGIFVATYGTTTWAELRAAYDAGKCIVVNKSSRLYWLYTAYSNGMQFRCPGLSKTPYCECYDNDYWGYGDLAQHHASDHAADGIDPISPASIGALPALGESINDPETNIDDLTLTKCYLCGATVISKGLQGNLPFDKSHLLKVEDFTGTGTRAIQTAVLNNAKAPERKWRLWNGTLWSAWQEG